MQILIVLLIFFIIVFVFIFRKKWIASKENKLKPEFSQKTINPITDKALPENMPEQVKVEEKNKIDELEEDETVCWIHNEFKDEFGNCPICLEEKEDGEKP